MLRPSSAGPLLAEAVGLEGAGGMGGAKKGSAPEEAVDGSTESCSRPEKRSAGSGKEPELHGTEPVVTTRVIAQSLKTCRSFCKRACEVGHTANNARQSYPQGCNPYGRVLCYVPC